MFKTVVQNFIHNFCSKLLFTIFTHNFCSQLSFTTFIHEFCTQLLFTTLHKNGPVGSFHGLNWSSFYRPLDNGIFFDLKSFCSHLLARTYSVPAFGSRQSTAGNGVVATIFIIIFFLFSPPFFLLRRDLFSEKECSDQKTYLAKLA